MPIGAEGENFLNFGPFFGDLLPFFLLLGRSGGGGTCPRCPHPKYATARYTVTPFSSHQKILTFWSHWGNPITPPGPNPG